MSYIPAYVNKLRNGEKVTTPYRRGWTSYYDEMSYNSKVLIYPISGSTSLNIGSFIVGEVPAGTKVTCLNGKGLPVADIAIKEWDRVFFDKIAEISKDGRKFAVTKYSGGIRGLVWVDFQYILGKAISLTKHGGVEQEVRPDGIVVWRSIPVTIELK